MQLHYTEIVSPFWILLFFFLLDGVVFTSGLIIPHYWGKIFLCALPNALWIVRFSRLAVGISNIPGPVWALSTINSNSFMWFFPRRHGVFSYTFIDRYSAEYSRGAPCQSQKLLLCFDSEAVIMQRSGIWKMGMLSMGEEETAQYLGRRIPAKHDVEAKKNLPNENLELVRRLI